MERLHLLRHKEEYPNAIFAHLSFVGSIDRPLFQQAFDFMVARHEMAVASLCAQAKWWQRPEDGSAEQSVLVWHDRDFDLQPYETQPVSLTVGEGFRCEVFVGENKVDLVTQIHHAKVDGLGALQGIRDVLCAYNNLVANQPIDHGFRRLDPESFKNRHRIGLFQKGWWKRLPIQWIPVYGAIKFGMARVSHLLGETTPTASQQPLVQFPSFLQEKLDQATYAKLRVGDASVNENLLAALFLAVDRFQKESGIKRGKDKLRIVVPISIRDRADLRGSACNRMAFVQLDRTDRDLQDPAGLIWGINYELGIINRFNFEKAVLVTMKLMSLIPGFLYWRLSRRKCKATTLLTNLVRSVSKLEGSLGRRIHGLREHEMLGGGTDSSLL